MDEELGGRMGAAQILGRGVRESPLLRQGFGFTMLLAIIGAAGRVVIPVVVQQAIDHGFVPFVCAVCRVVLFLLCAVVV